MGTRADFWVGTGKEAEWLGSVALDGYEWAEDEACVLHLATSEDEFRGAVGDILSSREDATTPDMGWPWPWNTSATTDYAYFFKAGKVSWEDRSDWPDMSDKKAVTFGNRSGVLIYGG